MLDKLIFVLLINNREGSKSEKCRACRRAGREKRDKNKDQRKTKNIESSVFGVK
ncbi:MAG: hypothetical protein KAS18_06985 [Calditrichia bacterium]|nr:hypothetical protein [Calditrichia bacterium]